MYTKQNGNSFVQYLLVLMTVFALVVPMTACGLSDWEYELPNHYVVERINSENIVFGKKEVIKASYFFVFKKNYYYLNEKVPSIVTRFCYNESHIALVRVPAEDRSVNMESDVESNPEYYIMDAMGDVLYGPYTVDEYYEKCTELNIGELEDWIKTDKKPKGAK